MALLWLSLAFLTGILLGDTFPLPRTTWLVMGAFCFVLIVLRHLCAPLLRNLSIVRNFQLIDHLFIGLSINLPPVSLILFIICLGGFRYQLSRPDLTDPGFIAAYNDTGETVLLQGLLVKPPDNRDQFTQLVIRAGKFHPLDDLRPIPVSGLVSVITQSSDGWQYGDLILVRGVLETPPEGEIFSYRDYLVRKGIYSMMRGHSVSLLETRSAGNPLVRQVYAFRRHAHRIVYQLWPDPEASLLAGILLGIESGIPRSVKQDFQETGTSHIIVISGFNITIVAALFSAIFGRMLGRWRGAAVAAIGIALYTLLVGADAAVVRAAIMGGLSLFARQIGRRQDGLNSLAIVAALMALFEPNVLWQASFQLSFMTTLGLILYAGPFSQGFISLASLRLPLSSAQRLAGPVGEYLLFTLAAQLTGLPITLWLFRHLSLSSLIANPLILPAQPAVMVLGGLSLIVGLIYVPLGRLVAYLAWPFMAYTIRVVEMIAKIPGGAVPLGRITLGAVLLYYIFLFGWTLVEPFIGGLLARLQDQESPGGSDAWKSTFMGLSLLFLAVVNIVIWRDVFNKPDGRLHMTVLAVSEKSRSGDAILIQSPTGGYVLINGGPSASRLSDYLGQYLPLADRRLDYVVVANPADDQVAALSYMVERFPTTGVLWAGSLQGSVEAQNLRKSITAAGIPVVPAQSGQSLDLGSGAVLRILVAGKRGAIFCLEWGNFRALIPLGINFEDLESLRYGREVGPVTALLLADHGYAPSNPPEWVNNLIPKVILLSVFEGNKQGFPSPEILQTIYGYNVLRTDQNGCIHLSTDGNRFWVEVEK